MYQSPLDSSKFFSDYSGNKQSKSNRKSYLNSFQKSINFSNRKF
ncbi:unnamed protein product [Paramecium pentaurelia]|uniref:Uncharacterized protein n=1 Tax=Paramecium pentaurelia TaxID=43138 RepID=A0A8S1UG73_9CILI|nr:unnamed protein product [Paramecium pentaurelia]